MTEAARAENAMERIMALEDEIERLQRERDALRAVLKYIADHPDSSDWIEKIARAALEQTT